MHRLIRPTAAYRQVGEIAVSREGGGHDPSGAKRTRKYLTLLYTLQLRKIMSSLVTVPPLTSQQLSPLIKWGRGGGGEQSVYSPQKPPLLCNRVIN